MADEPLTKEEIAALHKLRNEQQIEAVVKPAMEKLICEVFRIPYDKLNGTHWTRIAEMSDGVRDNNEFYKKNVNTLQDMCDMHIKNKKRLDGAKSIIIDRIVNWTIGAGGALFCGWVLKKFGIQLPTGPS